MLQITRIDLHHKLQLLIRICFLSDYRLLFLMFLLLTLSMCYFCWKRHSTKTIVVLILKYLAQQTYTYTNSETLKANSRDCASLLTTCSMSKILFKWFLVYYEHVFIYCDVFAVTISFLDVFIVNYKQISHLIYFYLLSVLNWVRKKPPEMMFFKKRCSLKLRNIFSKMPVLGSLSNNVVGLQDCKYTKRRLQHRCFVRNSRKSLKVH